MNKGEVFISYSWGGESEKIVDEITAVFASTQYLLIRDKIESGYKDNIKKFMQRIGKGNFIIVVISDRYLKSPNCMYEVREIKNNNSIYERIFPIVLNDARIYKEIDRIEYLNYWDQELNLLEKKAKTMKSSVGKERVYKNINIYADIRGIIDEITEMLADMNTLTAEIHKANSFSELIKGIDKKYNEDYNISAPTAELLPKDFLGLKVNNYVITEYISSGGFGSVYKAKHENLDTVVAIKISHQITKGYRNINDVIAVGVNGLKLLNHPNIVKVEDLSEISFNGDKRLVIVMEYISGGTLKDLNKAGLSADDIQKRIEMFIKIANAILYAHSKKYKNSLGYSVTGLMHGDIKPTNILLTNEGEPKVMDFMFVDLNKLLEIETKVPEYLKLNNYGTIAAGTVGYMSPEQEVQGDVDEQTDIFALGILLFEIFSPEQFHKFSFSNESEVDQELASHNKLPKPIAKIVYKATRKNRMERYESVKEIIAELAEIKNVV